ncbi:DUF6356 family protein [Gammaproteobacteria bacterium]|nr:DUF6356 family protein [Gammaproteobacteria bacterium]
MKIDLNHLSKTKIGYFSHGARLIVISFKLILLGLAGIIHSIFPMILVTTVSDGIKKITDEISNF